MFTIVDNNARYSAVQWLNLIFSQIVRMVVPSSVQDRPIVVVCQSGISFMATAGSVYGLVA